MRAWYRRHPLLFIFKELLSFSLLWSAIAVLLPFYYSACIELIFLLLLLWISYIAREDREPFRVDEDFDDPWLGDHPASFIMVNILMVVTVTGMWGSSPWFQWMALSVLHIGLLMQLHIYWWRCRFLNIRLERAFP